MLRLILPALLALALAAPTAAETIRWQDPRAPDSDGNTPLHFAAKELPAAEVAALIAAGVKVNAKNIQGWTPLHAAVRWGTAEKIRLLLEAGADTESRTVMGWSPLDYAARYSGEAKANLLLAAGADPFAAGRDGWTSLHVAARYGSAKMVRLLLEAGAEIEAQTGFIGDDHTPLHLAAGSTDPEAVKVLTAAGAKVNVRNKVGYTPLHRAVAHNENPAEIVRLLLEAGANPDAVDDKKDGFVPLHFAVDFVSTRPARLLLEAGANPNAADRKGRTALHRAAYDGTPEMVELLLDAGADPSLRMRAYGRGTAADEGRLNSKLRGTRTLERLIAEAKLGPKSMRMPGCEGGWKVARGQTIGDIAEGALGDRKRYREIMALNGLSRERPHRLGECLKLP